MQRAGILTIFLLAALALLVSHSASTSASKEESFWNWFQANEERLYSIGPDNAVIVEDLIQELRKVDEALAFHFGATNNDGRREFVLTVDAYLAAFPAVESLYAAAPELPRWTIVKFRQREPVDGGKVMAVVDGEIQSGEMRYIMTTKGGRAAIKLFLPGAARMPEYPNIYVARLRLIEILGEEDFATLVYAVGVSDITHEDYDVGKPIADLPGEFDAALKN